MLTAKTQEAIRWALARWLPGMRAACPGVSAGFPFTFGHAHTVTEPCPGYQPAPTTAEGLIDVGRLIGAIEETGLDVSYDKLYRWTVAPEPFSAENEYDTLAECDPDLGVAFLRAVKAWPLKEDA